MVVGSLVVGGGLIFWDVWYLRGHKTLMVYRGTNWRRGICVFGDRLNDLRDCRWWRGGFARCDSVVRAADVRGFKGVIPGVSG